MSIKNVNFIDKKNQKSDFYKNEKVTRIQDTDANKILVSEKEPYDTKNSFRYFIGYKVNDVIRPLCIKFPQMTGYVRKFEGNTTMLFKINDKQLLRKYNQIWERVERLLKMEFDSEPAYVDSDNYTKRKIIIYAGSMITNFQSKKMRKEKAPNKCLSIIMLDSVSKVKKK